MRAVWDWRGNELSEKEIVSMESTSSQAKIRMNDGQRRPPGRVAASRSPVQREWHFVATFENLGFRWHGYMAKSNLIVCI